MKKEVFYFSHDFNSRHDPKLMTVQMEYQMEGVGIFWCLVEMLHEQGGFVRTEYERIAFELHCQSDKVKWIVEQSGLFEISDGKFYSPSALDRIKHREDKSVKASESASKRWDKGLNNANAMRTHSEGNAIKEKKVNDIKRKESKVNNITHEDFPVSKMNLYTEEDAAELEAELSNNFTQLEAISVALEREYKRFVNPADIQKMIPDFILHIKAQGKFPIKLSEAKSYLANWVKVKQFGKRRPEKPLSRTEQNALVWEELNKQPA